MSKIFTLYSIFFFTTILSADWAEARCRDYDIQAPVLCATYKVAEILDEKKCLFKIEVQNVVEMAKIKTKFDWTRKRIKNTTSIVATLKEKSCNTKKTGSTGVGVISRICRDNRSILTSTKQLLSDWGLLKPDPEYWIRDSYTIQRGPDKNKTVTCVDQEKEK